MAEMAEYIKKSRERRGWTQEDVAAKAPFSIDVYSKIERGIKEFVPHDYLVSIINVLDDKKLAFQLLQECPVWDMVLPRLEEKSLSRAALGVLRSIEYVQAEKLRIYDVTENNIVDHHEQQDQREIKRVIIEMVRAGMEYLMADGEFDTELLK